MTKYGKISKVHISPKCPTSLTCYLKMSIDQVREIGIVGPHVQIHQQPIGSTTVLTRGPEAIIYWEEKAAAGRRTWPVFNIAVSRSMY